jgi:hypothetical protein
MLAHPSVQNDQRSIFDQDQSSQLTEMLSLVTVEVCHAFSDPDFSCHCGLCDDAGVGAKQVA